MFTWLPIAWMRTALLVYAWISCIWLCYSRCYLSEMESLIVRHDHPFPFPIHKWGMLIGVAFVNLKDPAMLCEHNYHFLMVLQYLGHDLKFFRNIVCSIQGFAELEYGMLRYMGAIDDKTLIVTSGNYGISSLFLVHLLTVTQLSLPKCIILLSKYHFIVHIVNMYLLIGRIVSLYLVSCLREK